MKNVILSLLATIALVACNGDGNKSDNQLNPNSGDVKFNVQVLSQDKTKNTTVNVGEMVNFTVSLVDSSKIKNKVLVKLRYSEAGISGPSEVELSASDNEKTIQAKVDTNVQVGKKFVINAYNSTDEQISNNFTVTVIDAKNISITVNPGTIITDANKKETFKISLNIPQAFKSNNFKNDSIITVQLSVKDHSERVNLDKKECIFNINNLEECNNFVSIDQLNYDGMIILEVKENKYNIESTSLIIKTNPQQFTFYVDNKKIDSDQIIVKRRIDPTDTSSSEIKLSSEFLPVDYSNSYFAYIDVASLFDDSTILVTPKECNITFSNATCVLGNIYDNMNVGTYPKHETLIIQDKANNKIIKEFYLTVE